jgi:hypothetical protein
MISIRAPSAHSLGNLTANPLCWDLCSDLDITETFATKGDLISVFSLDCRVRYLANESWSLQIFSNLMLPPTWGVMIYRAKKKTLYPMQSHHKFTVSFFLQPRGYLSSCPCTKFATLDGSKLNHLHLSGSSHGIFRIPFITSVCSEMGSLWQRAKKWPEMNLRGLIVRYGELKVCVGALETWSILTLSGQYRCHGIIPYGLRISSVHPTNWANNFFDNFWLKWNQNLRILSLEAYPKMHKKYLEKTWI